MKFNNKKGVVKYIFIAAALIAVVALILVNFNVGREKTNGNSITWRAVNSDPNSVTGYATATAASTAKVTKVTYIAATKQVTVEITKSDGVDTVYIIPDATGYYPYAADGITGVVMPPSTQSGSNFLLNKYVDSSKGLTSAQIAVQDTTLSNGMKKDLLVISTQAYVPSVSAADLEQVKSGAYNGKTYTGSAWIPVASTTQGGTQNVASGTTSTAAPINDGIVRWDANTGQATLNGQKVDFLIGVNPQVKNAIGGQTATLANGKLTLANGVVVQPSSLVQGNVVVATPNGQSVSYAPAVSSGAGAVTPVSSSAPLITNYVSLDTAGLQRSIPKSIVTAIVPSASGAEYDSTANAFIISGGIKVTPVPNSGSYTYTDATGKTGVINPVAGTNYVINQPTNGVASLRTTNSEGAAIVPVIENLPSSTAAYLAANPTVLQGTTYVNGVFSKQDGSTITPNGNVLVTTGPKVQGQQTVAQTVTLVNSDGLGKTVVVPKGQVSVDTAGKVTVSSGTAVQTYVTDGSAYVMTDSTTKLVTRSTIVNGQEIPIVENQVYWDAMGKAKITVNGIIQEVPLLDGASDKVKTQLSGKTITANDAGYVGYVVMSDGTKITVNSQQTNALLVTPSSGTMYSEPKVMPVAGTPQAVQQPAQQIKDSNIPFKDSVTGAEKLVPASVINSRISTIAGTITGLAYDSKANTYTVSDSTKTVVFTPDANGGYTYADSTGSAGVIQPIAGTNYIIDKVIDKVNGATTANLLIPATSGGAVAQTVPINPSVANYLTANSALLTDTTFANGVFTNSKDGSKLELQGNVLIATGVKQEGKAAEQKITLLNSVGQMINVPVLPGGKFSVDQKGVVTVNGATYYTDGKVFVSKDQAGIVTKTTVVGPNTVATKVDANGRPTETSVTNGQTIQIVTTTYDAKTGLPTTTINIGGTQTITVNGYAASMIHQAVKDGNGFAQIPTDPSSLIITPKPGDTTQEYKLIQPSADGSALVKTGTNGFVKDSSGAIVFSPDPKSTVTVSMLTGAETSGVQAPPVLQNVPYALAAELSPTSFDMKSKTGVGGVVFNNNQVFYAGKVLPNGKTDSWAVTYSTDGTRVVTRMGMTDAAKPETYTVEASKILDSNNPAALIGFRTTTYDPADIQHKTPLKDQLGFTQAGFANGIPVSPGYIGYQVAGDGKNTWTIESPGQWTIGKFTEGTNYGLHVDPDSGRIDLVGRDGKPVAPTDPAYQAAMKDKVVSAQKIALQQQWNYESTGLRFNAAYQAAIAANKLSSLFCGGTDCFKGWRKGVEDFFDSAVGWLSTPESTFCRSYVDKGGNDGYAFVTNAYGDVEIASHVEGERSKLMNYVNDTNSTDNVKEYLYKLTYYVKAPIDEDIAFHIELSGPRNKISLFDGNKKLTKGTTDSARGQTALVKYSRGDYNKICLVFDGAVDWKNPLCNKIVDQPTTPTALDLEARKNNPYAYISGYTATDAAGGTGTLTADW